MRRKYDNDDYLKSVNLIKSKLTNPSISTDVIVGFPGETEEEFEELLDFLREAQLDRVGAFAYSPVEGARANDLPDPVPENIKQERLARFMEVQGEISAARLKARIGNEYQVVIDSVDAEGAVGRTYADAPEVDGLVHLNGVYDVKPGDRVWAEVIHANEHDVWAVLSEDQDEEDEGADSAN